MIRSGNKRICAVCGLAYPLAKHGDCCSKTCETVKATEDGKSKKCKQCGEQVYVVGSVFCSRICVRLFFGLNKDSVDVVVNHPLSRRAANAKRNKQKRPRAQKRGICKHCGAEFYRGPNAVFCSDTCSRRNKILKQSFDKEVRDSLSDCRRADQNKDMIYYARWLRHRHLVPAHEWASAPVSARLTYFERACSQ